jgi:hypothetical protein
VKNRPPLTALESVRARDVEGGTAPRQVQDKLDRERGQLARWREWLAQQDQARAALFTRPSPDEGQ